MQRIYQFIQDTVAAGHTVLVYRTRAVGRDARVKHVKSIDRVSVVDGVVHVDGVSETVSRAETYERMARETGSEILARLYRERAAYWRLVQETS